MVTIIIPTTFSELESLDSESLRKIIRMATAVLNEREPVTRPASDSAVQSSVQPVRPQRRSKRRKGGEAERWE